MKKLYTYISLAAVVLGLAGCAKELSTVDNQISKTDEKLYEVNLGAAIGDTKTSMGTGDNDGKVLWSTGDQISVTINCGTARTFTVSAGSGTTSATFTGLVNADEKAAIEAGSAALAATYPASGAEVPGTQTFVDGNFADDMFPMTGEGNGAALTFTNPASIVMAKDVKVGDATSAELKYTVGGTAAKKTISNISGVTEADLLFVVEAGADKDSFTLTLEGSSFAHKCYTSATTVAGARYILNQYTCKIGNTQYKTLALAVAAVPTTGVETTIQMIANETFAENTGVTIAKTQKVALDLNGKVIGNNITVEKASATITNNGYLTVKDSSADADGIITNGATEEATGDWWSDPQKNWATNTITNYGTLVLESGNIQNTATGISYCVDNSSNGVAATFEMKGGKMKDAGCAMRLHCNSDEYLNKVIISGGIIESIGSHPFWVQLPAGGSKKVYLEISGGEFKGSSAYCWYDWAESGTFDNASYSITGGKFVGGIYTYKQNYKFITGGLFDSKSYDDGTDQWELSSMVADGYSVVANTDASTKDAYPWKVEQAKVAEVGDTEYATLAAAIAAVPTDGTQTTIKMIANATIDINTEIAGNKKVVLELNGKTISGSASGKGTNYYLMTIGSGADVTIQDTPGNGKITFTATEHDTGYGNEYCTIYNCGGILTIASGTIENGTNGGAAYAVTTSSNAWGSPITTEFNLKGGTLTSPSGDGALRIYQNNSNQTSNNVVNISGGTIADTGLFVDTFWYQTSENVSVIINITGGKICGLVDLKLRHKTTEMNISGGEFNNVEFRVRKGSSPNYFETYGYPDGAFVNITGGKFEFSSESRVFKKAYVDNGNDWDTYYPYSITGGYYNYNNFTTASGYEVVENTDAETKGTYGYKVAKKTAVAKINTTEYATLEAAFDAANEAGTATITMLADYQLAEGNNGVEVQKDKNITLDLNGKTVKNLVNADDHSRVIHVANGGAFTVNDSGTGGTITNKLKDGIHCGHWQDYNYVTGVIVNEGTLVINAGTIKENYASAKSTIGFAIDNNNNTGSAVTTIKGGTITNGRYAIRQFCQSATLDNSITVKGGTITGEKAAIWTQLTSGDASVNKKADVVIEGGTISGNTHGMLVESAGNNFGNVNVTISGGTFSGSAPVTICGGHLRVSGGAFNSGLRVSHYGRNEDGDAPASGVEFVRDYEVKDGTFNGSVYSFYTAIGTAEEGDAAMKFLKGGTYSANPSTFVASGYKVIESGDVWKIEANDSN